MDTTILYLTDNTLDPEIDQVCKRWLVKQSGSIPIVSVSHKPMDFGANVYVGDIGRSWLSLHKQLHIGLQIVKTKYVVICEHDCIYCKEHLNWIPEDDGVFWYNDNMWLLQWKSTKPELDGMFSRWPKRYALSQLVCARDLLLNTIDKRLNVIDKHRGLLKTLEHVGEPGVTTAILEKLQSRASNGSRAYLHKMLKTFAEYLETEKMNVFKTRQANIDIRHSTNFTGPKRGGRRRSSLPHWGTIYDIIKQGD